MNELKHHGILGQKWGVRRYQNPDGTWTDEGLRRRGLHREDRASAYSQYGSIANNTSSIVKNVSKAHRENAVPDISKMSDAELQKAVNRMNLEAQYSKLSSSQVSKGERYLTASLEVVGGVMAIAASAATIANLCMKAKG